MKSTYAIILLCLILLGGLASCTEEEVKPTNATGGLDDWEKHNV